MAHVLLVMSRKGGVGKTTSAFHLAEAWAADTDVVLVDTDNQQQAVKWYAGWQEVVEGSPGTRRPPERMSVVGVPDGKSSNIEKLLVGDGIVILDAPGGADPLMTKRRSSLYRHAHAVLMLSGPSIADAIEVAPTAHEIAEFVPGALTAVALVKVGARAETDAAAIREALENRRQVTVLEAQVRDSMHIMRSYGRPTCRIGREDYGALATELREALGW